MAVAAQTYDGVSVGQEFTLEEATDSQRLVIWAAASGDFYQIHYDDNFAKNNKLPDIIVHGALKGMWVGKILDQIAGRPQPFVADRGSRSPAAADALQACGFHQSLDPLATDTDAGIS